jgi:hypothetical protein
MIISSKMISLQGTVTVTHAGIANSTNLTHKGPVYFVMSLAVYNEKLLSQFFRPGIFLSM